MIALFKFTLKLIKWLIIGIFTIGIAVGGYGAYLLFQLNKELPANFNDLRQSNHALPTIIYDRHGNQVEEIFIHRQIVVPFEAFPPYLIQALIATEDPRFFSHFGLDPLRILKAVGATLKGEEVAQNATTLTQQTARLFLSPDEQSVVEKLKEMVLALKIEHQFSKEEILTLYLNKVFLGNAEGIEAATQGYFGKHAKELNLAESALLTALLPDPSNYAPTVNPDLAKQHRNLVLRRMFAEGFITEEERRSASRSPIKLNQLYDNTAAATAYYVEHVRNYLLKRYGVEALYEGGLKVYLAMDLEYQIYAHEALQNGILEVSQRQGYRGAMDRLRLNSQGELSQRDIYSVTQKNQLILGNIVQGVVTKLSQSGAVVRLGQDQGWLEWSHLRRWKVRNFPQKIKAVRVQNPTQILKMGDVVQVKLEDWNPKTEQFRLTLHQEPLVNGAIFSINPRTGEVLAMSGGYHYEQSDFNRALQAKRQPGTAFKPIVYASAIDAGYTLASILVDSPRFYNAETADVKEGDWAPKNFGNKLLGNVSLRTALVESLNLPTIGLVEDLQPQKVIDYARKLGISSEMEDNLTIALGTFPITLQEMVSAFGVFANDGNLQDPIYITRVEDHEGTVLEEHPPQGRPVISEETAFLILDALQDVVQQGSGRFAQKIDRPSAGKTGTTNENMDAWYIGFVPQLLTGVYVGFDQPIPMGKEETGEKVATPIWVDYMASVTKNLPTQRFVQPPQIVSVKIHKSGRRIGPCDPQNEIYYELFKQGTEPLIDSSLEQNCEMPQETQTTQKVEIDL